MLRGYASVNFLDQCDLTVGIMLSVFGSWPAKIAWRYRKIMAAVLSRILTTNLVLLGALNARRDNDMNERIHHPCMTFIPSPLCYRDSCRWLISVRPTPPPVSIVPGLLPKAYQLDAHQCRSPLTSRCIHAPFSPDFPPNHANVASRFAIKLVLGRFKRDAPSLGFVACESSLQRR